MAIGTTRGKRRLGRFIKPLRLRSGLSAEEVAERASCSEQTVYRLEAGDSLPSRLRVAAILAVLQATDNEREKAFQLWEVADVDGSVIEHAQDLPVKYRRFRMDENEAVSERTLDMVMVPGLLQTDDYARAVSVGMRRLIKSPDWEEQAGAERAERRALLTRTDPLTCHALIGAAVLRTRVGSRAIMIEQLDHLLAMAELDNVIIQVLPSDFGAHGGFAGAAQLLRFVDNEEAAYAESVLGIEPFREPNAIATLSAMWDDIASAAPSPEQSREILRTERRRTR